MNDESQVSLQEIRKLYSKAILPLCLVIVVFMVYFWYYAEKAPYLRSTFDLLLKWGTHVRCRYQG